MMPGGEAPVRPAIGQLVIPWKAVNRGGGEAQRGRTTKGNRNLHPGYVLKGRTMIRKTGGM
eukprot:12627081-Heterocapsa_arctica.AAC.1